MTANNIFKETNLPEGKSGITELVFILDRSGSMAGLEGDTVGGFNAMIKKQKALEGKVFVSTVLFNSTSSVLHDRVDLSEISEMKEKDFTVGGCTALIDALGDAVNHIGNIHKYARAEDVPENTVFVIMTDGMENASRRHSSDEVKKLIEKKKELGWEFLFLGANIDAVETAARYGIGADRSVDFRCDDVGVRLNYETVSDAVCCMRAKGAVPDSWSDRIKEDKKSRS